MICHAFYILEIPKMGSAKWIRRNLNGNINQLCQFLEALNTKDPSIMICGLWFVFEYIRIRKLRIRNSIGFDRAFVFEYIQVVLRIAGLLLTIPNNTCLLLYSHATFSFILTFTYCFWKWIVFVANSTIRSVHSA